MPENTISLRLPDGLDALIRRHAGETSPTLTDDMRQLERSEAAKESIFVGV